MDALGILGRFTMRRHSLVALLLAVTLLIPATAYAEDQEVNVHVLSPDTLGLSLEQGVDLGGMQLGETRHHDFWLNVVNTTPLGFSITVSGGDFESFDWAGCDMNGCWDPIYTGVTIPSTSLVVTGGDTEQFDGQDNVVGSFAVNVTPDPQTIVTATEAARGEFGFDAPMASLDLTIPGDATPLLQYRTVLTYTISGPVPTP
jgi:hypothetical protein